MLGAWTSSINTPAPPPLGWMKHTSNPAAPLRIPPGVNCTPRSVNHATAAGRSSIHSPMWLSLGSCTLGDLAGSIGSIRSISTPPTVRMSSSTFSFSLR